VRFRRRARGCIEGDSASDFVAELEPGNDADTQVVGGAQLVGRDRERCGVTDVGIDDQQPCKPTAAHPGGERQEHVDQ
jgi:hypothetical protein